MWATSYMLRTCTSPCGIYTNFLCVSRSDATDDSDLETTGVSSLSKSKKYRLYQLNHVGNELHA
jgi:hypothetical protein